MLLAIDKMYHMKTLLILEVALTQIKAVMQNLKGLSQKIINKYQTPLLYCRSQILKSQFFVATKEKNAIEWSNWKNLLQYKFPVGIPMQKRYIQRKVSEQEANQIRLKGIKLIKYFQKVYLHVAAAAKMLSHAHFGIPRQVMGLLQGSYHEEQGSGVFVVTDVIFLPVQSSETRVTADDETYTLIAAYSQWINKIKTHHIVGWYHSHPSFGCWLSGIDVATQQLFQKNTDPFVAIVVDPIKSTNLQKLDIAAFRVHPNGYKEQTNSNIQDVPRRKAVDFGYHYQRYYQLSMEIITNETGQTTLKKVQKIEWASELAYSSFFKQSKYLREEVEDEKADIEQYLEVRESPASKWADIKEKERTTMKKVAYYTKQRNISLIDSAVKSLLF